MEITFMLLVPMSLAPLLAAPAVVQLHAFAALAALVLGLVQFAGVKGTRAHRLLGWAWVLLMLTVAASSFAITGHAGKGRLSWVHALSAWVLLFAPLALLAARRGKVRLHGRSMAGLYIGALLVTGALTLLPGRIMHGVVFGTG
jgi:uncharacterized membrane protein